MLKEEKYYTYNDVEVGDIFAIAELDAEEGGNDIVVEFLTFLWDYYQVKELGITPVEGN